MTQTTPPKKHRTQKTAIYIIFSIVIILTILAVAFVFLFQPNGFGHNQPDVKITDFSLNNQWSYLGGLTMDCSFNVTVENRGMGNVTGLVLEVKMFHNGSEVQVGNYFFDTYENGTVKEPLGVGEERVFRGTIMSNVGDDAYRYFGSNETVIVAYASLGNIVLDQRKSN